MFEKQQLENSDEINQKYIIYYEYYLNKLRNRSFILKI